MNQSGEPWVPPAHTIHEAIAWWAERTPDAPALLDVAGEVVSFHELVRRIEAFGSLLRALGIGRGDRVVLALPDGVAAAIAGLAATRVAVGVPVNPAQSRLEAEPLLGAVAPSAVIVAENSETVYGDLAVHAGLPLLEIDSGGQVLIDVAPVSSGAAWPAADDLALILLTSGTTDQPRRVPATHRNLLSTCSARVRVRRLGSRDRGLSSAPAYFVLGLARVAESLISGGSVIVTSAAEMVRCPEAIRDMRPTWAWLNPAILETILDAARAKPAFAEWPLRHVRSGGSLVTPELIDRAQELWRVPVLNGYGTTETLGYISAEESPQTIPRKRGSVGLARPGLELAIRDPEGVALPAGATGEITVRGERVFTGYLDDPEATAAAFDPGGWYRTGDLGHLDEEGYLFVTGRAREMINRGGEKIVPHEVDDALRAHSAVADAAAFALPHRRLGEEVAAAVVLREPGSLSERDLRRWVAGRLSPHKVPRRIWFVAELPRTGSSKVQRGVLTERFRERGDA
jgi:acyl-CoA synthetase (AMP-forming)/AMP-acid ligase II